MAIVWVAGWRSCMPAPSLTRQRGPDSPNRKLIWASTPWQGQLSSYLCWWAGKKPWRSSCLGEMFDAAEALRLGIINEVVPASTLMERVREVATRLAAKPRLAAEIHYGLRLAGRLPDPGTRPGFGGQMLRHLLHEPGCHPGFGRRSLRNGRRGSNLRIMGVIPARVQIPGRRRFICISRKQNQYAPKSHSLRGISLSSSPETW